MFLAPPEVRRLYDYPIILGPRVEAAIILCPRCSNSGSSMPSASSAVASSNEASVLSLVAAASSCSRSCRADIIDLDSDPPPPCAFRTAVANVFF